MNEIMVPCYFGMVILDYITISSLRSFLIDFLIGRRNRKSAHTIHSQQPLKERITLSYIKPFLKHYIAEFKFHHRIYMVVIYTIIPQYFSLLLCGFIWGIKSIYLLGCFASLKFIICLVIRLQTDSNRISIYRKK